MAALHLPCHSSVVSSTRPPALLHMLSPFKGNVLNLHTIPIQCRPVNLFNNVIRRRRRLILIKNSSSTAEATVIAPPRRLRLHNLAPQPGSRKRAKRKGRGHSAGQGGSCGFGMKGQKSRSGPGIRKGFEGGQMPLYRRIPKLRGIAGGMRAGLPKFLPVNLKHIVTAGFQEGEEVSLETLKKKGLINPSGRERTLPLKILGDGELSVKLNIKARAFSASAKQKLEAAGCSMTVLPGRKKWVKPSVAKNMARAQEYYARKKSAAIADLPSA